MDLNALAMSALALVFLLNKTIKTNRAQRLARGNPRAWNLNILRSACGSPAATPGLEWLSSSAASYAARHAKSRKPPVDEETRLSLVSALRVAYLARYRRVGLGGILKFRRLLDPKMLQLQVEELSDREAPPTTAELAEAADKMRAEDRRCGTDTENSTPAQRARQEFEARAGDATASHAAPSVADGAPTAQDLLIAEKFPRHPPEDDRQGGEDEEEAYRSPRLHG